MNTSNKKKTGWKRKILHELIEYWSSVLYMAIFFGVFTNYRRLILAHHQISYEDYGISLIKALVLAKVVLVAKSLRLGQRFDDKPLIVPTLYKAFLFTICVGIFGVVESIIRALLGGRNLLESVDELIGKFNYEWLAGALVVFFAFIPFFAVIELRKVLGEGTIAKFFFRGRSTWRPSLTVHRTDQERDEPADK